MGLFALVLHTHLPYVRRNGVWPSGEDYFHQAAVESYLPLLDVLERIAGLGVRDALTIGMTPLVANQLEDPYMLRELHLYLGRIELRAQRQVANYRGDDADHIKDLAAGYALAARGASARLDALPAGTGIASAYGALERAGLIELLGGPASHPYLPLVREPALARAQVALGAAEHRRIFGRPPAGMWLPECAYAPDRGIEELLAGHGVGHVVVDGPSMLKAAGPGATFRVHTIGDSPVAAFARNLDVTYRVWSPTGGYPANGWYRDYFRYDVEGGFKNWRVTSRTAPLHEKRPYEPERALARARADAADFVTLLHESLEACEAETGREGVVVACYDTELFGHWWHEGPAWLEEVYRLLAAGGRVRPATLTEVRERLGDAGPVSLGEGSWGFRKDHRSWVAPETEEIWEGLRTIEAETVRIAAAPQAGPGRRAAFDQLLREALLAQSSDWPFMIVRGRNPGYARERFEGHRCRWAELAALLDGGASDEACGAAAARLREQDNPFPELDAAALLDGGSPAQRVARSS